ncbi:hypothetical protein FRC07_002064 [Ceratobasidium sp. 392]|nr:hypothetical protein FRC07_002064 [Ceratobasidium sp. 392]
MNVNSQSEFDSLLSSTSELIVIEFYATTDSIPLALEDTSTKYTNVTFAKVDAGSVEDLAKSVSNYLIYDVAATPKFVLFKQKEVLETVEGDDLPAITAAIAKHALAVDEQTSTAPEPSEVSLESNTEELAKSEGPTENEPKDQAVKEETTKEDPATEAATTSNPPEPKPPIVLSTEALNSMWNSDVLANADSGALPPPRHFDDTLSQLRLTFLPKTQHKAVHVVDGSLLVEPTLALYCPLEGGEYVIDATVKELAKKADAEVQVIDMAHVAAGEWGNFGKVASGFRHKNNPLGKVGPGESSDDDDDDSKNLEALESFWKALIDSNPPVPAKPEEDASSCRPSAKEWDEGASKDRAKRLKKLKEKWNKGTLLKELPSFKPRVKILKEKKEPEKDEDKDEKKDQEDSKDSDSSSNSESSTSEDDPTYEQKLDGYFRSCIIAPATRRVKSERAAREKRRRELNELMVRMLVGVKGGQIEAGAAPVCPEDGDLMKGWDERLIESDTLKDVVDRALGTAMLSDQEDKDQGRTLVTWAQLQEAWRAKNSSDEERKAWTSADVSDENSDEEEEEKEDEKEEEKPPVDEVIEKVKAADLDEYEQRLIGCIVDVVKIPTTFENVHLPMEVIDSVRSIVSLPLLFPDAFKTGILKQQAISGALLFGPPGTGKTLVVRALAKESGARMLAIKPSDVADKWVGETEKLVRSLFKLARRLKPCVVFIDEIDSLMGSRQSKACSGGSRWHTSMLTEFMQEMDGLMASSVIVIGATNRPFDIDDAVLRRLPCRLLVDLPGERAREEILKIMLRDDELGPDVSIGDLAKKTDRFSGSDLKHLCVAAAMDALKESVKLPWAIKKEESKATPSPNETPAADRSKPESTSSEAKKLEKESTKTPPFDESDDGSSLYSSSEAQSPPSSNTTTPDEEPAKTEPKPPKRILLARHFLRALMDVAPSSSESQGSLSELRKWNTQFGTGARDKPQSRPTGSLSYGYGGGGATGTGLNGMSGVNGLSSYGSSGLGSSGLGSTCLGSPGLGATGLGASGLGSSGLTSGFGSSKLGLGSSSFGTSNLSALPSGVGYPSAAAGAGYGAGGTGYTPPTYTTPSLGDTMAGTGYTPKFPVYSRDIPGYNPGAPGGNPSAPGS